MLANSPVDSLGAIDWSFANSTARDLTHDLHPWPAKFIPDIPASAIRLLTEPGELVVDPFCGCGTTAVEALRTRRDVVVSDVNPLATLIAAAKTTPLSETVRDAIAEWALGLHPVPDNAEPTWAPAIPNIDYWFSAPVQAQLAALLDAITAFDGGSSFLQVALSAIIVGASRQESETRYRRVDRETTPAEVMARFQKKIRTGLRMLADLEAVAAGHRARVLTADARTFTRTTGPLNAALAVFSPPYPNAFDYHLYHRFRMFWLGMDPRPIKHDEIGAHLRYEPSSVWEADMKAAFHQVAESLRLGGYAICVVGDGIVNGEIFGSADALWALAESVGLEPVWRVRRPIARTRRAFNLADSRLREEHMLAFRR